MTYQIVRVGFVESDGWSSTTHWAERLPNAYETRACAHAIASRLHTALDACADIAYYVVPFGGSPWRDRLYAPNPAWLSEETPF